MWLQDQLQLLLWPWETPCPWLIILQPIIIRCCCSTTVESLLERTVFPLRPPQHNHFHLWHGIAWPWISYDSKRIIMPIKEQSCSQTIWLNSCRLLPLTCMILSSYSSVWLCWKPRMLRIEMSIMSLQHLRKFWRFIAQFTYTDFYRSHANVEYTINNNT